MVCLLADRDLSRTGVEVDFFGEPTRMPAGPALLAATTGAALLPVGLCASPTDGLGRSGSTRRSSCREGRLREQVAAG